MAYAIGNMPAESLLDSATNERKAREVQSLAKAIQAEACVAGKYGTARISFEIENGTITTVLGKFEQNFRPDSNGRNGRG